MQGCGRQNLYFQMIYAAKSTCRELSYRGFLRDTASLYFRFEYMVVLSEVT